MTQSKNQSIFSPTIDFLTVGGLSYIYILYIWFFPIPIYVNAAIAAYIVYIINDPHFLSSYQLFYNGFYRKIKSDYFSNFMRIRYIIAGIIVPFAIIISFIYSHINDDIQVLAITGSIMLFLVGWHYTKQSYGMLLTLSAFKKIYYSELDKKIFLINAYILWITTWLYMNNNISTYNLFGVDISLFVLPKELLILLLTASYITGILCAIRVLIKYIEEKKISFNGLVGYSTAYIWLFFRWDDPVTYMLIPVFHSLQYLPFILKYKINDLKEHQNFNIMILKFIFTALFLGTISFHTLPWILDNNVDYNNDIFGNNIFLFMFAIFINIHHYFIDNVLWRKENKDISSVLFKN